MILGSNLVKSWHLAPMYWLNFMKLIKNTLTGLFVRWSTLLVPLFVQIRHAGSERHAKTWFWGQIWSTFDLWPLPMRPFFKKIKNAITSLFLWQYGLSLPSLVTIELVKSKLKRKMSFWPIFSNFGVLV